MKLIITEKPSVAKNIADAMKVIKKGEGYIECECYYITWAFGHLVSLYDAKDYDKKYSKWLMDNFPIIPREFKYKVKNDPKDKNKDDQGAKKQLKIIKTLAEKKEVKSLISACDYDREGQIIGDLIIDYIGTKKPVERLLANEWTEEEVKNGLKNIKPNSELKNVSDAGISRQWSDWLIGINLTSVATLKYSNFDSGVLNIGRVLLPTLKIIYDRDQEIKNFKAKDYYKLEGVFSLGQEKYTGIYNKDGEDKFDKKEDLISLQRKLKKEGEVVKKETKRKKENPPYLFNLSSLQGHITSKYSGFTSDKVLKVAQALYEKKYTTYPRTASMFLEDSLVEKTKKVVNILKKGHPLEKDINFNDKSRIFNNKKVEGHSAIIPTYVKPKGLSKDEQIVYDEIRDRLFAQFMPQFEYDETIVETKVEDVEGVFISKGKILVKEGFKAIYGGKKAESDSIPSVSKGDRVNVEESNIRAYQTCPPSLHNEKTLLRSMETAGKIVSKNSEEEVLNSILSGFSIGTPATRAETITKLKTAKYVELKGKSLRCTPLGIRLVENFPVKTLLDLEYTGRLEKALSDIEKGRVTKEEFVGFICKFTTKSVADIKIDTSFIVDKVEGKENDNESLGKCLACGCAIVENKLSYSCSGYASGCKFSVWKNDKFLASMGKKPNKTMVKTLLKDGKVMAKGLKSKKGNVFDAYLSLEKNGEYYNWKMEFLKR